MSLFFQHCKQSLCIGHDHHGPERDRLVSGLQSRSLDVSPCDIGPSQILVHVYLQRSKFFTVSILCSFFSDHSYGGMGYAWLASNNYHWLYTFKFLITFNFGSRSITRSYLLLATLEVDFVCFGAMMYKTIWLNKAQEKLYNQEM